MNDLKRYKIKPEYHHLAKNLAAGQELSTADLFRDLDPANPSRKSIASEEEARTKISIVDALMKSGILIEISTGIVPVEKT